jgi:hypothetical protein
VIVAYVPDLMDRSKLTGARFVSRPSELIGTGATTIVVDLSRPGVLDELPAIVATGARVIGFGSHVDGATLDAARAAGAEALPRSAFFARVGELLG